MKKAFVTGIAGQDGSYLADLLLSKGYEVHGMTRRTSPTNMGNIQHLLKGDRPLTIHTGDLTDNATLAKYIREIRPDEIYNLGGQSHVRTSFDMPEYTADVVGLGCLRLLEAIREENLPCKFYQASSSEMFGNAAAPQSEKTPFNPVSPYAIAKLFAHHTTIHYRQSYDIFAVSGILFNHESPRRGDNFVTRKITKALAQILKGSLKELHLGNLDAKRDWGFAPEYVEAIWLMMQLEKPEDFIIATGEAHSVREFLHGAFGLVGLDWEKYVKFDQSYLRKKEVDCIQGDASSATKRLGWKPRTRFLDLVKIMVKADLEQEGLKPETFIKQ